MRRPDECPKHDTQSYWTVGSKLLRCGCPARHSTATATHHDLAAKIRQGFGSAVYWYLTAERNSPHRFRLVGLNDTDAQAARYALSRLLPLRGIDVEVEINGMPLVKMLPSDLAVPWVDDITQRANLVLPTLAARLREEAGVDAFRWYRAVSGKYWSGRLDGLELCRATNRGLTFDVGKPGKNGHVSAYRQRFLTVAGGRKVFAPAQLSGAVSLLRQLAQDQQLTQIIRELEHCLEARLLRGTIPIRVGGDLQPFEEVPFQFPAKWWPSDSRRSIDILMLQGETPWVVELKLESQGEYYREGIVQAALYREYIRSATSLAPYFRARGVDHTRCQAAVVFPQLNGTDSEPLRHAHQQVGEAFGVQVIEVQWP